MRIRKKKKKTPSPFLEEALGVRHDEEDTASGGLSFRRRGRYEFDTRRAAKILGWTVRVAIVLVLSWFLVRIFCVQEAVNGPSMEPLLASGDRVLVNRLPMSVWHPASGEVIAFYPEGDRNAAVSIKRVAAVPGDTVVIRAGVLYVNGATEHSLVTMETMADPGLAAEELTLGPGEYFVLGDNRNNAQDSRYESVGMIHTDEMVGRVWFDLTRGHRGVVH